MAREQGFIIYGQLYCLGQAQKSARCMRCTTRAIQSCLEDQSPVSIRWHFTSMQREAIEIRKHGVLNMNKRKETLAPNVLVADD